MVANYKDFNFFLLPKNLTFTNDITRLYNERQVRNNMVPEYEFAPVFLKTFNWDRNYSIIGYDLTKNIKAGLTQQTEQFLKRESSC